MGVYCDVHMCVRGDGPLSADARARIVEISVAHELLAGDCAIAVSEPIVPTGPWEWIKENLLLRPLAEDFARHGLRPYAGVRSDRGVKVIEEAIAASQVAAQVKALTDTIDVMVGCGRPKWKGRFVDGGFIYLAMRAPVKVFTSNAYRRDEERSPFEAKDGHVGSFFDVLSLSSKSDLDGRAAASSAFVRELKKELGLKLTCRATWW